MDYRNTETKLDQLVGYFNEKKINLSPIFQRGRVWTLKMRRELIKNIIRRRPIPAIFLYKDEAGSKYTYAILDGKQRLESILMFIGAKNPAFSITTWHEYIYGAADRRNVGFAVSLGDGGKARRFTDFDDKAIRDLREYPIPTIEIALSETTQLDEIINLFVDINAYGARVTRLNIVRAVKRNDPLLRDVYALVAVKQPRRQDIYTKRKKTPYVGVLRRLQTISSVSDPAAQADRMWERLFELALFVRSGGTHRKPTEILKSFLKKPERGQSKLTKSERAKLARAFVFLRDAYNKSTLGKSRFASDQTHFYIMSTSLLAGDLLDTVDHSELIARLVKFSRLLRSKTSSDHQVQEYLDLSSKQTTDAEKRKQRQALFEKIVKKL